MSTVFMTKGLPASGKSTWAREAVAQSQGHVVEVTKDQLRLLPQAPVGRGKKEKWVIQQRNLLVSEALASGKDIIVHDTGFNPVHERVLRALADQFGAYFQVVDFTSVDVHECVRRDAKRADAVGAAVIWGMWQQYLYTPPVSQTTPGVKAVLVDIDGTLARMTDRGPFEWAKVGSDQPVGHVVEMVRVLAASGYQIIFMSGRDEVCRPETEAWLSAHVNVTGPLFMRPVGDVRPDNLVKEELFHKHVEGVYQVQFVLDDRDQVVFMWRDKLHIPCFQVEYGNF